MLALLGGKGQCAVIKTQKMSARNGRARSFDRTAFARDVVEAALAHAIENKTEAAYRRSNALEKRRRLMGAWAAYCEAREAGNVTPLQRSAGS